MVYLEAHQMETPKDKEKYDRLKDDHLNSLDMPDKKYILKMVHEAKEDSIKAMPCGLDHLRLMRVMREYGDRRYRAGFSEAIKITNE